MKYQLFSNMKKLTYAILFIVLFFSSNLLKAEKNMHLGFVAGLAVPNEKISQFFSDSRERLE